MRGLWLILLVLISCKQNENHYAITILDQNEIQLENLQKLDLEGKNLLIGYLYAYGNECQNTSTSSKCQILNSLDVEDECDEAHLYNLRNWFSEVILIKYKLNDCPALPFDHATQNSFEKIVIERHSDNLSITYRIKGVNESQEKNWNLEQTDQYLIDRGVFEKI